jgi:hypothetical protein
MGKYSDRNKSAANAQAPKTINVSGDQSYEYRRDRGFVTMKYYFHGADWEYWASQMAAKDMTAEQMSYFIGAKYERAANTMLLRGDFRYRLPRCLGWVVTTTSCFTRLLRPPRWCFLVRLPGGRFFVPA